MQRILYDSHMHTPLCRHATGDPVQYAQAGYDRGLRGIVFTCHNPMPDSYGHFGRMRVEQIPQYAQLVDQARRQWDGRLEVHLGLECDYLPGMENWLEQQLGEADFQYVLGSLHPHLPGYRKAYWHDDPAEYQRGYFNLLAQAAETGLFDALAHPDLVKNVTPNDWHPTRLMDVIGHSLDRIARTNIAMELNTSGLLKPVAERNPGPLILQQMAKRRIPVILGSDAHKPYRVAEGFEAALTALEAAGYQQVSYCLGSRRQTLSITDARASLIPAAWQPTRTR